MLAVGNDADVSTHARCGSYATRSVAKFVVPCRAVGRYLSIRRSGGPEPRFLTLCEVIIIGYVYNGDESSGKFTAD